MFITYSSHIPYNNLITDSAVYFAVSSRTCVQRAVVCDVDRGCLVTDSVGSHTAEGVIDRLLYF